jgi:hypothetical protein
MNIDKDKVREIQADIKTVLEGVAAKHGLTVEVGGGRFDASQYIPKVTFKAPGADRAAFERDAGQVGLAADDFGRIVTLSGGRRFELLGINLRRPKYPILARNLDDDKVYKLTEAAVAR